MASTLVQQYMHIVFHTKCTSITMREEDLGRLYSCRYDDIEDNDENYE